MVLQEVESREENPRNEMNVKKGDQNEGSFGSFVVEVSLCIEGEIIDLHQ